MESSLRIARKLKSDRPESAPSFYDAKKVLQLLNFLLHPTLCLESKGNSRHRFVGKKIRMLRRTLTRFIAQGLAFGKNMPCYSWRRFRTEAKHIAEGIVEMLPALHSQLHHDVEAAYQGDPASRSKEEVVLAYPAISAITCYRVAHELWKQRVPLVPRIMTEYVHGKTGIDIHPGAVIGHSFFIDHGTGVVIGETSVIGNNVRIYQGVTLGALSIPSRDIQGKRHPTVEDNVIIYTGAVILGGETVIGSNSIVGGNTWITRSVPPGSRVMRKKDDTNAQLEARIT